MISYKDIVIPDGSDDVGLSLLIGKKIKEVRGYFSDIGGGATFKLSRIEFEDGTQLSAEGEHDFPYLVEWDAQPNFDEETLERLSKEQNGE